MSDDDRAWASVALDQVIADARAEALEEVRRQVRDRMVDALHDELRRRETAPAPAAHGSALWLYGITGAIDDPADWPGVSGGAVRTVRAAGLCALVSDVPLPEFGTQALQSSLEDLDRVEALARAHEQVLERAAELTTVVPSRMCTIYASDASVREMLERERAVLVAALEALAGRREWGVKVYATRAADDATEPDGTASGTAYLTRKREAREAAERAREHRADALAEIHAQIGEHAVAAVLGRPQDRRLAGRADEMVLNASYLVPDDRFDAFRRAVVDLGERHAAAGLDLELTGPWPPYHFVDLEARA